ncbi:MAG: Uma2 family endonuclease [Flavisolibacter sp.]|nr:Uma2 family endonuclease [Flavisolibacter sp.]MBD0352728.1 Uma2 family endonuclease [Flavisolibacter sp.]
MEPVVLKFPPSTQFTDDELFEFCVTNKELRIERDKNGKLIIMPPTGGMTSNRNFKVNGLFAQWAAHNEHLGYGFDSSGGFRLPNRAMRAPDAAWVKKERWEQLSPEEQKKFPPLTPDFIIEIRSESDSLKELQDKMQEWIENGCRLAWLIDPLEQKAYVYTPEDATKIIESFNEKLNGGDVLPGFELDLSVLK